MTEISFNTKDNTRVIKCEGHAGYAASGYDVVCAGISAIIQSYAFYLLDLQDKKECELKKMLIAEGLCEIEAYSESLEAKAAYEMTVQGLCVLAESYPEFAHVKTWVEIEETIFVE